MNNRFLRHLQFTLAGLDLFAINLVFFASRYFFRDHEASGAADEYAFFGIVLTVSWFFASLVLNIYNEKHIVSFESFVRKSMLAFLLYIASVSLFLFFFQQYIISRSFLLVIFAGIPVGLLINRFLYLAIHQYFKNQESLIDKVVLLGYNHISKNLVSQFEQEAINKRIMGYCDEDRNINELSHYPILSNLQDAFEVCKQHGVTEIYSCVSPEQNPELYKLIQLADENCIRFKIVPDIGYFVKRQVHIDYFKGIPILSLRKEPLEDLSNRITKRVFDIVVSLIAVVFVLSWLLPLLSIAIWLDSKGPIFFKQKRSGRDNKSFTCWKFRSMKLNELAHERQASKDDNRFTRLGRLLRKSNLDEFPQFINVLRGDMSVVGPRPHMLKHTDEYSKVVRQYMVRQFLKPGITGWAQVNGYRGEIRTLENIEGRVRHDIWYMENWSIWLDVRIMFQTVYNVFRGEANAY